MNKVDYAIATMALATMFGEYGASRIAWQNKAHLPFPRRCGARRARGPLPPSGRDPMAELERLNGKQFRHVVTGEVREVHASRRRDCAVFYAQPAGAVGWRRFDRPARKALQWIRNAIEVRS